MDSAAIRNMSCREILKTGVLDLYNINWELSAEYMWLLQQMLNISIETIFSYLCFTYPRSFGNRCYLWKHVMRYRSFVPFFGFLDYCQGGQSCYYPIFIWKTECNSTAPGHKLPWWSKQASCHKWNTAVFSIIKHIFGKIHQIVSLMTTYQNLLLHSVTLSVQIQKHSSPQRPHYPLNFQLFQRQWVHLASKQTCQWWTLETVPSSLLSLETNGLTIKPFRFYFHIPTRL